MPLRPRALLTLIVALGLQAAPAHPDSPSDQPANLNLTTLTISDAISEAEAWQSSQPQPQCCVATADLCCPAGAACRPPYGCIALAAPEPVPASTPAMGALAAPEPVPAITPAVATEPQGFQAAAGAGPPGTMAVAAPEPVPASIPAMGTEPQGFQAAEGAGQLGTMAVAVLVVSCVCLGLLACCVKQLCACMFDPGRDGEWSGGQMGMAGLGGAAAGYELGQMMDGYGGGGGYGGGFGGPAW